MNRKNSKTDSRQAAIAIFNRCGGMLRTSEAIRAGIHQRTLYALRDAGVIERIARGLYRLASRPPLGHPDLVPIAAKIPGGVLCLISALAFHDLTTQIPHQVYLAVQRGSEFPRLEYPPVRIFQFGARSFRAGVELHKIDGVPMRVYNPEKTLVDCFKFRNKIGLDTALEALRLYRDRRTVKVGQIMRFAAICRVTKIIRPYLEAIV